MLNVKSYDEKVKSTFKKYIELVGLDKDHDFYRSVDHVKSDVQFFQEYMSRTQKKSNYFFEPKLSMQGLIHNGFFQKINRYFNYYDYELLSHHLYMFEILKRLFVNNWVSGVGVNMECVKQVIEFHSVVVYYLNEPTIECYVSDFIGSSYGITEFMKAVEHEQNLELQGVS